ncbi:uncharacterized protein LOC122057303 [Macadamia integrifolia]|uniref:uncharacterized protein LOC122057303 n=1 Tax=Macadamia integrifolia TaxID=60698 RepID=UPI001C531178|nr:uncharacterized protein LOC122057303 [Macadamia integrifolia]
MCRAGRVAITTQLRNSIGGLVGIGNYPETRRCLWKACTINADLFPLHCSLHRSPTLRTSTFPFLVLHPSSSSWSKSMFSGNTNSAAASAAASATDPPPPSNPTKTVRAMIKGRVQGVFYRNWTVENAKQLGLRGWVRNKRDGSVEALFSGHPDSVNEMEQRCRRGPPDAMVTSLQVFPSDEAPGPGFDRRQTV